MRRCGRQLICHLVAIQLICHCDKASMFFFTCGSDTSFVSLLKAKRDQNNVAHEIAVVVRRTGAGAVSSSAVPDHIAHVINTVL